MCAWMFRSIIFGNNFRGKTAGMKLIPVVNLLLPLLASPLLSAAVASDEQQPFSYVEVSSLLAEGDDCERLAAYLGDHVLEHSLEVDDRLEAAIRLNRPGSFRCLYAHIHFPDPLGYIHTRQLSYYLGLALLHHQPEICDFLLEIDFQILGRGTRFWEQVPFLWAADELVDIVRRHPRLFAYIVPEWNPLPTTASFAAATTMVDFFERILEGDKDLFQRGYNCPKKLLECLVRNEVLADAEMASLFARLLQMGAEVRKEVLEMIVEMHPNYVMAYETLLDMQEVKEPADE